MSLPVATLFLSFITHCRKLDAYNADVVKHPIRQASIVNIMQDGKVLKAINLPGQEVNGFSLDYARKTKAGFEFSIEYGSRMYYHKQFIFICRRNNFYLSRVIVDSFDKHNPEKSRMKVNRFNLPLEKFIVTNFMREVFP